MGKLLSNALGAIATSSIVIDLIHSPFTIMLILQNEELLPRLQIRYSLGDLQRLRTFLEQQGTWSFPALDNGLYPAAITKAETEYTGYASVWVRDNIHIAYFQYVTENPRQAIATLSTLARYFQKYRHRFENIISGQANPTEVMERPHVRFDGKNLAELTEKWAQAQNDALGYFLWLYSTLAAAGLLSPSAEDRQLLALFPPYFQAIQYWQDEDSGHWEETRKIEASSIGTVVAGLKAYSAIAPHEDSSFIEELIVRGENALSRILPAECIQSEPEKQRRYDSALLFLIYPLKVVEGEMADQILSDVIENLQGDYGIRRYLGDSYWCADYKQKLSPENRTIDFSDNLSDRDALLQPGEEAQWCIFDPIISAIYGQKYRQTRQSIDLDRQTHYLNRSLGQITGQDSEFDPWKCPELYYREGGKYTNSDATPLLWTQGNLAIALHELELSLT